MLNIRQKQYDDIITWKTQCPFCSNMLRWYVSSPVLCHMCKNEMPRFSNLIEDVTARREHHFFSNLWVVGEPCS